MKHSLIILVLLAFNFNAEASDVLFSKVVSAADSISTVGFKYKRSTHEAWIEVNTQVPDGDGGMMPSDSVRISVPGLSYDRATESVIYETSQGRIHCAQRVKKLFWHQLKETKNCSIQTEFVWVQIPINPVTGEQSQRLLRVYLKI